MLDSVPGHVAGNTVGLGRPAQVMQVKSDSGEVGHQGCEELRGGRDIVGSTGEAVPAPIPASQTLTEGAQAHIKGQLLNLGSLFRLHR